MKRGDPESIVGTHNGVLAAETHAAKLNGDYQTNDYYIEMFDPIRAAHQMNDLMVATKRIAAQFRAIKEAKS
ncbi:hypothetical protein E3T46_07800 [Cryobacterium sp. Hh11]|uniref:hypothetical protein n=1 Tax=Cryobacterium sp. Hh11 TaxID=2555868 RepID=UPI001069B0E5|nr:hypothetical protein [Cryobacterium sp. Hh11]TFD51983.1 hypothetical protein E3T46_07800 [Cryobacterium sp. Hh11]